MSRCTAASAEAIAPALAASSVNPMLASLAVSMAFDSVEPSDLVCSATCPTVSLGPPPEHPASTPSSASVDTPRMIRRDVEVHFMSPCFVIAPSRLVSAPSEST